MIKYFVPCSDTFNNFVKDRKSKRYWKVLIDINGDGVLDDVTYLLYNNSVTGSGKSGGQSGEAVSNQYKIQLRNPAGAIREGAFANALCAIEAKVGTAEYIRLFTGFVSEQGSVRSVSSATDDVIAIEMVDGFKQMAMGRKTDKKVLINHLISDPVNKESSILHKLCAMMGILETALDIGEKINYRKPYAPLDGTTTVLSELQDLSAGYLGLLTFRYDGKLRFRSRFEDGWQEPEPEWFFDESNVHNITGRGDMVFCNKVVTEFEEHQVLDLRVVYINTENYNVVTKQINIPVAPGDYWPGVTGLDKAKLSYREPTGDGEVYPIGINIQTPTIGVTGSGSDIQCTGGLLSLESFNGIAGINPLKTAQCPDGSEIILYNNTSQTITITNFQIRGQPVRVNKKTTVEDRDNSITNPWEWKEKKITGKYAVSQDQAHLTTSWWLEYGKVKRKVYDIQTDWLPQVQEGAKVTLNLTSLSINMTGIIVNYTHPAAKGAMSRQITKLSIQENYDYSTASAPLVVVNNMGRSGAESADALNAQIAAIEDEVDNRPTYQEMQEGYTNSGGVKIPAIPVILLCIPVAVKAIMLLVNKQAELTNFDHYEWQVSSDQASWYALCFDGTDWKAALNDKTNTTVELLTHCNIPHTGESDSPSGRTLYYRVRRVTKAGLYSDYSPMKSATTNTVNAGDLASNSVYANNLVAGVINALIAQLSSYLEVGGDGFIGKNYGSTSGYQECGLWGKDKSLQTGLSTNHAYYFKIAVDGGLLTEYMVQTVSDTTYNALINSLNNVITGCLFDLVGGDLRCSSSKTGDSSSIALAAGTSGDDLFSHLTGFTAFDAAVIGEDNPVVWGSTRSRIFQDSWIIEFWNGGDWTMITKGGGQYNGELFPYIQTRGIVSPGSESALDGIDYGQLIPATGSPSLFKLDNSYMNQNSVDPWDTKQSVGFSTAVRKYGTHCLVSLNDTGKLEENAGFGIKLNAPFGLDFWFSVNDFTETEKTFFQLGRSGTNTIHYHNNTQTVLSSTETVCFDVCEITEIKIACVYKTTTGSLSVKIGDIASDSLITWGAAAVVTTTSTAVFDIKVVDENIIIITYSRLVDSTYSLFCKIGVINGSAVSFTTEQTIKTGIGSSLVFTAPIDTAHVVFCYNGSTAKVLRIGKLSGTQLTFYSEYTFASTADTLLGVTAVKSTLFIVYFKEASTGYLKVVSGNITNDTVVSISAGVSASGTRIISSGLVIKLDSSSFAAGYIEITTNTLFVKRGYFTTFTPTFNSEYQAAASIDKVKLTCCGKTPGAADFDILFNLKTTASTNGVLMPAKAVSSGVFTFYTASAAYDSNVTALSVIGRNPIMFLSVWMSTISGTTTIKSRSAAKDGFKFMAFSAVKNYLTNKSEIAFWFVNSDDTANELISVKNIFTDATSTWNHFSVNYDQTNKILNASVNLYQASVNLSSYTLTTEALTLSFYFMTSDALDDFMVIPSVYSLTSQDSIDHYKNNVRWSITYNFKKDIVISPAPGGKVFFPLETAGKVYAVYAP